MSDDDAVEHTNKLEIFEIQESPELLTSLQCQTWLGYLVTLYLPVHGTHYSPLRPTQHKIWVLFFIPTLLFLLNVIHLVIYVFFSWGERKIIYDEVFDTHRRPVLDNVAMSNQLAMQFV